MKKLRKEGKTNEQFEIMLNNLTLEELIAAKLELSCKTLGSPIYGLPIYKHLPEIVEDAVIKFAVSCTQTPQEAAAFLGLTPLKFHRIVKRYKLYTYFNPNYDKLVQEKKAAKALEATNAETNTDTSERDTE